MKRPSTPRSQRAAERLGIAVAHRGSAGSVRAIGEMDGGKRSAAFQLASWLTLKLRKPVKPATIRAIFHAGFWIVQWIVLPVLLLPLAAGLAAHGWRGWRTVAVRRPWRFWIAVTGAGGVGVLAAASDLGWRPHVCGFGVENGQFCGAAGIAYLLFCGAPSS